MKTTRYLDTHPGTRPRIFAHRGFTMADGKQVADENTFQSFERALSAGADYIESDIQVTKDSIPVLFHDNDLKRLTGSKDKISELNLSEIKEIKLPFGGTIPSLRQALSEFPDAKFNLDFKTKFSESVGIEVIEDIKAQDRVLVSSFSERSRRRALANATSPLASSAGSAKVLACYLAAMTGREKALARILSGIDALQIPMHRYGLDFTHPKFLEHVLPSGVEIHYWTINDPTVMKELFALGAHGIVTDRTDLAVANFS